MWRKGWWLTCMLHQHWFLVVETWACKLGIYHNSVLVEVSGVGVQVLTSFVGSGRGGGARGEGAVQSGASGSTEGFNSEPLKDAQKLRREDIWRSKQPGKRPNQCGSFGSFRLFFGRRSLGVRPLWRKTFLMIVVAISDRFRTVSNVEKDDFQRSFERHPLPCGAVGETFSGSNSRTRL